MPQGPEAVKLVEGALALGFSLSEAIQRALGCSLSAFAADIGVGRSEVSMCLNKYEGRIYEQIREALAQRLGVDRSQVDAWIDGEPAAEEVA